jgi:hypothetical protein
MFAPLYGRLLASPTNIRLGWKGLSGTNTLAYYKKPQITAVISFIVQDPGVNVIKLFFFVADKEDYSVIRFTLGKPFQPSLIFRRKARRLP